MTNPERMMQEWNDKAVRPPCEADSDTQGCVIAWHMYDGVQITGWRYVLQNSLITHWFPTPLPPDDAKRPLYD